MPRRWIVLNSILSSNKSTFICQFNYIYMLDGWIIFVTPLIQFLIKEPHGKSSLLIVFICIYIMTFISILITLQISFYFLLSLGMDKLSSLVRVVQFENKFHVLLFGSGKLIRNRNWIILFIIARFLIQSQYLAHVQSCLIFLRK